METTITPSLNTATETVSIHLQVELSVFPCVNSYLQFLSVALKLRKWPLVQVVSVIIVVSVELILMQHQAFQEVSRPPQTFLDYPPVIVQAHKRQLPELVSPQQHLLFAKINSLSSRKLTSPCCLRRTWKNGLFNSLKPSSRCLAIIRKGKEKDERGSS